ncbi:recombinase RecT [Halomonas sp. 86]|uniref:recombinase RecT n=1 Tax=unclassified Halomonas TaxID=2609666 RepID=UPI0040338474
MSNAIATLTEDIYAQRDAFAAVLSEPSLNFDREAGFAIQAMQSNDFLAKIAMSNRQSLVNAVNNTASIGISLNPAKKQAYLVPRDGRVCLDISYMGLVDLATSTGSIRWAQAELVHASDHFELSGIDRAPLHKFNPFHPERGDIVGAYVVVKTADGDYLTTCMSRADIDSIMNRSQSVKSGKSSPWKTDYGEMAKKTVVKRAYKYWPKTERLENAIHHLNTDGGEGLAPTDKQQSNPELANRWINEVIKAESAEALAEIWKNGLAEIRASKDMVAYNQFKAEVAKRGDALKQAEQNTYEGETA